MKVLNSIKKHIGNSYEENRKHVLDLYTAEDAQPTWIPYLGSWKKEHKN